MRYIIKRIIIGVGIAIAMMFLTRTFSLSVHAATSFYVAPNELRLTYENTNGSLNTATYSSLHTIEPTQYPYNTFYGRNNINQYYTIYQQLYRIEVPSNYKSGYYDLNFLYYNADLQDMVFNNISANIRNASRTHVCQTDNMANPYLAGTNGNNSQYLYGMSKKIVGVSCSNVYLELNSNNVVYAVLDFTMNNVVTATPYGITAVTFQHNDSNDKLIQNQQTIIQKEQQQTDAINNNTDAINDVNNSLNDDDTSDAQDEAGNFFGNFSSTDHGGLSGIITAPMRFIQRLTNFNPASCRPVAFPLPFMNRNASIPCLSSVVLYSSASDFVQIYRTITTGLIAYWVIVKVFAHIRSFKKPDEDKVEVLEL